MPGKLRLVMVLFFAAVFFSGCAMGISPVTGVLYTGVKGPLQASGASGHTLVGTSSCYSLLGLVAIGDASIDSAAKSANINTISHVDFKTVSLLGLFSKVTTIVYGE